jgi:hypothetical protein
VRCMKNSLGTGGHAPVPGPQNNSSGDAAPSAAA